MWFWECKWVCCKPEHNANWGSHRAERADKKNGVICLAFTFTPEIIVIKMSKMTHFLYFLPMAAKNKEQFDQFWMHLKDVIQFFKIMLGPWNVRANWPWSARLWDIEDRNIKSSCVNKKIPNFYIFKGWHLANYSLTPSNS